jgi:replicative DNA helicase
VASAAENARTLFSAIVPDRRDLLEKAIAELSPEHFHDDTWKNMFIVFQWYYQIAGDVLTKKALSDALVKLPSSDTGKVRTYEAIYDNLEAQSASEADFRWSLEQIKDKYAHNATKNELLEAMQVLQHGIQGSKGEEIKGHAAARERLMAKFGQIDLRLNVQEAPDGDARDEEDDILQDYADKKALFLSGESVGIQTGIPAVDKYIGGFQPGELDFVLGYSSSGKSSLSVQIGWQASVRQGKNVVYVTTETLRPQIRRKIVSRHSKMSKFDMPEGLNSLDLKRGTLSPADEAKLKEVVHDFATNEEYGGFRIMQASEGMSISSLQVRLQALQAIKPIDLVIIDALYILKANERRPNSRDELNETIQAAKNLATTFNNGQGVPIVTPWQTSREHKERADRDKRYSMAAMAETAYAERFADVVISLLEPPQTQRYTTLSCAVIKNRDGEQSPNIDIDVDYATSHFSDSGRVVAMSTTSLLGF